MHAFIVTGGPKESREIFIREKNIKQTELIHIFAEKSSITIKQIQELNEPLAISTRIPRIIWIEEANLLTIPAQNSLLKILEEPPLNTTFYLTCDTLSSLLPTIRSRSESIKLNLKKPESDLSSLKELKEIMNLSPGDRLARIIKRDRSESLAWIIQIEQSLRDKLCDANLTPAHYKTLAKIAKSAIYTHLAYLSNCSIGLATQHFYLTLPHTHATK